MSEEGKTLNGRLYLCMLILLVLVFGLILALSLPLTIVDLVTGQQPFSVANIPDTERWHDLNNKAARDRFCQAMGYDRGRISENTGFGSVFVKDYAGNPYGYDIYCIRTVEEHGIYDYSAYKKWIISLEITGE